MIMSSSVDNVRFLRTISINLIARKGFMSQMWFAKSLNYALNYIEFSINGIMSVYGYTAAR